jgi:hypothetical protein
MTVVHRDINALQRLNASTPVAACFGKGVDVLRFQAPIIDQAKEFDRLQGHAANPLFYTGTRGHRQRVLQSLCKSLFSGS